MNAGPPPAGEPAAPAAAGRDRRGIVAHIRHELRTPLNAIIGYSEMLLEDAEDAGDAAAAERLRRINDAGRQLLALVNDRLESGRVAADGDLAQSVTELRARIAAPLAVVTESCRQLLEGEPPAPAEAAAELQKVLAAAGRLRALAEEAVELARLEGGDHALAGPGAGPSGMAREAASTVRLLSQRADLAATEQGRLLVVDDVETNRDVLARHLARQGHEVAAADGGRAALARLRAEPFDLVLLDMMMPEMNGFEVLQVLKSDPQLRHVPVVMLSALDEQDSVAQAIDMGAEDYLPKPFDPVLLRARIDACLEKKRLRDREVSYLQQIEAEKRRADELLRVILPAEIVEELKATSTVQPRLYENVAILFCDVVDFTPYCEQRSPEEVLSALQELIEAYEALALRYHLQKIKTIGDAFMATAGLLQKVENPVLSCVRCGLEMVAAAARLPAAWHVRVGIHAGPVMAGVVGHRQYLFDLWGDAVNTAARVEAAGAPDSVNLSGCAWEQVAAHCDGESLGLVSVKGKGEMEIFRVIALRDPAAAEADTRKS